MTLTLFPVSVVLANTSVLLLTNAVLLVVKPLALVLHGLIFAALGGVGVGALAFAFLRAFTNSISFSYKQLPGLSSQAKFEILTYASDELALVGITVGVVCCGFASVVPG